MFENVYFTFTFQGSFCCLKHYRLTVIFSYPIEDFFCLWLSLLLLWNHVNLTVYICSRESAFSLCLFMILCLFFYNFTIIKSNIFFKFILMGIPWISWICILYFSLFDKVETCHFYKFKVYSVLLWYIYIVKCHWSSMYHFTSL